jgi:hypothetical protein
MPFIGHHTKAKDHSQPIKKLKLNCYFCNEHLPRKICILFFFNRHLQRIFVVTIL